MTLAVRFVNRVAGRSTLVSDVALIVTGSLLLAVSAQVRFYLPNTPVPVTMQTLAVLLIGASLGSWRGMASVLTYLAAGSLGLPFFAGLKGGALALMGPTGGYLFGFVLAAGLVGWLAERKLDRKILSAFPTFILGQLVIYLLGTLWLSQFTGGFSQAVVAGIVPFLLGDAIKVGAAILLLPAAWRLVR